MKTIIVSVIFILLCGCVSSSGVLKMSPDTYSINIEAWNIKEARQLAYRAGNEECEKLGKVFLVKNWRENKQAGQFDLIFRCLTEGDPELAIRPEYELKDTPDVRIEDSRKRH